MNKGTLSSSTCTLLTVLVGCVSDGVIEKTLLGHVDWQAWGNFFSRLNFRILQFIERSYLEIYLSDSIVQVTCVMLFMTCWFNFILYVKFYSNL